MKVIKTIKADLSNPGNFFGGISLKKDSFEFVRGFLVEAAEGIEVLHLRTTKPPALSRAAEG